LDAGKTSLDIVRSVSDLRGKVRGWRAAGETVGLVPTMGALHDGHFSLVEASLTGTDRTCVTLFVNPKQFGEGDDFEVYPRDEATDAQALSARGAHLLFAPGVKDMYPEGFASSVSVPGIGDVLEGEFRPGFFTGVATVVTKLLLQALPDKAYFGEKDYQQLCVIRRMTADLDIPVEIVGCPIVRESDGLALSSRNAYLSADEREVAPALHQVLQETASRVAGGADPAAAGEDGAAALRQRGFAKVDYISVRDAETLAVPDGSDRPLRVLGAAWLGRTRLIDNIAIDC